MQSLISKMVDLPVGSVRLFCARVICAKPMTNISNCSISGTSVRVVFAALRVAHVLPRIGIVKNAGHNTRVSGK